MKRFRLLMASILGLVQLITPIHGLALAKSGASGFPVAYANYVPTSIRSLAIPLQNPFRASAYSPASAPFTASFPAMNDDNSRIPPGVGGAVGPAHLLITHNSGIRVMSRTGEELWSDTLRAFWSSLGPFKTDIGPFDPHCVFHPFAHRWVVVSCADSHSTGASLLVAISRSSDPTEGWRQWKILIDPSGKLWGDCPLIGFAGDHMAVSVNAYDMATNYLVRSHIYNFSMADLIAASSVAYTQFIDYSGTFCPAQTLDTTESRLFFIQNWSGGAGSLRLSQLTGNVLQTGIAYPRSTERWAVMGAAGGEFAPQAEIPDRITCWDARITSCVWRNNALWCAHTIFLPSAHPTRAAVQWWQIAENGAVIQLGKLDDAPNGLFYAYPSIAVNAAGTMLLACSRFSSNSHPSCIAAVKYVWDPLNTVRAPVVIKDGEATYCKRKASNTNRWGDYSTACVDPADSDALWTIQPYAASPLNGIDRWGTWWARIGGRTGEWRGAVQDNQAKPLPGAMIRLYDIVNRAFLPDIHQTDANGEFSIQLKDVAPGRYQICAWKEGCNTWIVSPGFAGWSIEDVPGNMEPVRMGLDPLAPDPCLVGGYAFQLNGTGTHTIRDPITVRIYSGGVEVAQTDAAPGGYWSVDSLRGIQLPGGISWWGWYTAVASWMLPEGSIRRTDVVNFALWPSAHLHMDMIFMD